MTTSQRMDAMAMTEHRRHPFPDTDQAAAYLEMMAQVRKLLDALVTGNPDAAQAEAIRATVAELTELLETVAVPEREQLYALGEMGVSHSQALVPPLTIDHFDAEALHAHFVPG